MQRRVVKLSFLSIANYLDIDKTISALCYNKSIIDTSTGVCMNNDERKLKCKAIGYQEKRGKISET